MMLVVALTALFCWLGMSARELDRPTRVRLVALITVLVLLDLARGIV